MHAQLHNLRLLYLAHEVERTFEGLERALSRHLPPELQEMLRPLFLGGPEHERLEAKLKQLNSQVQMEEGTVSVADLLQALRECERTAQRFYLEHLDELVDPELVQLFRGLAKEEGRHLEAVEAAIVLARGLDYTKRS